jgi:hypothetical protein
VSPAVDPKNGLAQEQATIIVGHLKLLNSQWDMAYLFEKRAFEEMNSLGRELLAVADGGSETQTAKLALEEELRAVPENKPHTSEGMSQYTRSIGNAIDELIYACHDDGAIEFKKLMAESVFAAGEKQIMRERIWFQATGLDPEPGKLPSIETMLLD